MSAESEINSRLKLIFGFDKVTFDKPSQSQEQEALFVDVKKNNSKVVDKREIHDVEGSIHVFAQQNKMPLGFLSKQIAQAAPEVKAPFFFFNEEPKGTFQNIVERSLSFRFLFNSQYDPNLGILDELTLSYTENE